MRCHDAEACELGQKECQMKWACHECPVINESYKPQEALIQIEEKDNG